MGKIGVKGDPLELAGGVTRALGDRYLKNEANEMALKSGKKPFFRSTPQIWTKGFGIGCVMGSDGLWDVCSKEEIVKLLLDNVYLSPNEIVNKILNHAKEQY